MRVRLLAVAVLAAVVAAVSVSAAGAGSERVRFKRVGTAGISIAIPKSWRNIRQVSPPKDPIVVDPQTRIVTASGKIVMGKGCNDIDYSISRRSVALVLVEWVAPTPYAKWTPRPRRFTNRVLPIKRNAVECFSGRGGAVQFAQHGRRFAAYILAGRSAPPSLISRARSALATLQISKSR